MNKLRTYFSLNFISLLGILLLLYIIFIFFILIYSNFTTNPNVEIFDVAYGIVNQFYKLYIFMLKLELILFVLFGVEFVIKKFVEYPQYKYLQSKKYKYIFNIGIVMSFLTILLLILQFLNF